MSSDDPTISAYETVLADLHRRREQIDSAIAAVEAMIAGGPTAISSAANARAGVSDAAVKSGDFLGMTISDAARKLLEMRKKPLTTKEIMESIVAGGVHLTSQAPMNTVATVLRRQTDIINVGRGTWGLAGWYPNSGRFKKAKQADESEDDGEEEKPADSGILG